MSSLKIISILIVYSLFFQCLVYAFSNVSVTLRPFLKFNKLRQPAKSSYEDTLKVKGGAQTQIIYVENDDIDSETKKVISSSRLLGTKNMPVKIFITLTHIPNTVACVIGYGHMYIDPEKFSNLDRYVKRVILEHELSHMAYPRSSEAEERKLKLATSIGPLFRWLEAKMSPETAGEIIEGVISSIKDVWPQICLLQDRYIEEAVSYIDYQLGECRSLHSSEIIENEPKTLTGIRFLQIYLSVVFPFELAEKQSDNAGRYLKEIQKDFEPFLERDIREQIIQIAKRDIKPFIRDGRVFPDGEAFYNMITQIYALCRDADIRDTRYIRRFM